MKKMMLTSLTIDRRELWNMVKPYVFSFMIGLWRFFVTLALAAVLFSDHIPLLKNLPGFME